MAGRCDFFNGATVQCGDCGQRQVFGDPRGGGGDTMARKAGWQIEWKPQPHVRCPKCVRTPAGRQALKEPTNTTEETK